jgi:DNA-binding ferritin-like protein
MPIYCNDSMLLYVGDNSLGTYKDYLKQAELKEMKEETNTEDISKEEFYLYNIISACENILDDLENGANIEQADFNNLGYVDGIMLRMQKNVKN